MKVKTIANIVLALVIIGLGYYLYKIIQEPIIFEREKKVRYKATVERLKDIRTAQVAYRERNGKYAKELNELIRALKTDSFPEVKIIGNPDDTSQVVQYDTTYIPLLERAWKEGYPALDSLAFIPYSGGDRFTMDAGEIEKNRIKVQVFEAIAPERSYLKQLIEDYDKYINDKGYLSVGSMTEASISGNWE
jgi:hypothetical protein